MRGKYFYKAAETLSEGHVPGGNIKGERLPNVSNHSPDQFYQLAPRYTGGLAGIRPYVSSSRQQRIVTAEPGHAPWNSTESWTSIGTWATSTGLNPNFGKYPSAVVVRR